MSELGREREATDAKLSELAKEREAAEAKLSDLKQELDEMTSILKEKAIKVSPAPVRC